jgi:hypothetical protein
MCGCTVQNYFGKQTGNSMVMVLLNLISLVVLDDMRSVIPHLESLISRNKDFSVDAVEVRSVG